MKKRMLLFVVAIGLLAGCQERTNTSTSTEASSSVSSESSLDETTAIADYYDDLDKFVGEWECIDPDFAGDRVTISEVPESNGLQITYDGEEATITTLKEVDSEEKLWRLHNEEIEMKYTIIDGDSGVITLYRATTAEGAVGVSKPMEYQKIA